MRSRRMRNEASELRLMLGAIFVAAAVVLFSLAQQLATESRVDSSPQSRGAPDRSPTAAAAAR